MNMSMAYIIFTFFQLQLWLKKYVACMTEVKENSGLKVKLRNFSVWKVESYTPHKWKKGYLVIHLLWNLYFRKFLRGVVV